ncbi:MAG TPA: DUF748 domain-containing protein [Burkholderiaceae bacterium]|jgi:hypothetical protein
MQHNLKRVAAILGIGSLIVIVGATTALHFATGALKTQVQHALGPHSEVGEVIVHWSSIELRGVHVRAPSDWPAGETLRADKIVVTPDLRALISSHLRVNRIEVENPYLSILRSRDGHVHLLPDMLENHSETKVAETQTAPSHQVDIATIEIHGGATEFYDASIKQPAHRIRIEQLEANISAIHVPNLPGRTTLKIDGVIKGIQSDGKLSLDGWIDIVGRDSELAAHLQGVDLIALQPYLIKAAETGVKRGKLDLVLNSSVRNNRLRAPGTVTLRELELAPGNGTMSTFMGVPRRAVIASLKDKNDRIVVPFTLDGNLDDPHFSLNESLASHVGDAVANVLGISIEGLTHGVGSAAQTAEGLVKKLFGK